MPTLLVFWVFLKIYLETEIERESAGGGGTEREGDSIPSRLPLITEPEVGLDLTTLRSGPKPKPRVGYSTDYATTRPHFAVLKLS